MPLTERYVSHSGGLLCRVITILACSARVTTSDSDGIWLLVLKLDWKVFVGGGAAMVSLPVYPKRRHAAVDETPFCLF